MKTSVWFGRPNMPINKHCTQCKTEKDAVAWNGADLREACSSWNCFGDLHYQSQSCEPTCGGAFQSTPKLLVRCFQNRLPVSVCCKYMKPIRQEKRTRHEASDYGHDTKQDYEVLRSTYGRESAKGNRSITSSRFLCLPTPKLKLLSLLFSSSLLRLLTL
jgi:hypothetical protein